MEEFLFLFLLHFGMDAAARFLQRFSGGGGGGAMK
jgi:hypothetical protein